MAVAWVFFRAESMGQALQVFEALLTEDTWTSISKWPISSHLEVQRWLLFLAIVHIIRGRGWDQPLLRIRHPIVVGMVWGILLFIMLIFHADTTERFIYFQF